MTNPTRLHRDEQAPPPLDLAIVGLACGFSRAVDLCDYWQSVVSGHAVHETPGINEPASVRSMIEAALADAGLTVENTDSQRMRAYLVSDRAQDLQSRPDRPCQQVVEHVVAILHSLHPDWDRQDVESIRRELTPSPSAPDSFVVDSVDTLSTALENASRSLEEKQTDFAIVVEANAGAVLLKRRADAERDRIYAVVQGLQNNPREWPETVRGGMLAIIKTALSLHHRALPPTDRDSKTVRPWIHGSLDPRTAQVILPCEQGTTLHVTLKEFQSPSQIGFSSCLLSWDSEAILLGAPDRDGWVALARALLAWLESGRNAQVLLKDLAYTLNTGQGDFSFRVGMVVSTIEDLRTRLQKVVSRLSDVGCRAIEDARGVYYWSEPLAGQGRLAFLYPGEGSQYPGMLTDLCIHFPEVREGLDTSDRIARDRGMKRLPSEQIFGVSSSENAGLFAVETAVNVVLSSNWALHRLLKTLGLKPDAVLGHSSGEFLSLAAAGVLEIDDYLEARLGEMGAVFEEMERESRLPSATMLAAAGDRERIETILRAIKSPAQVIIDNCPHQVILAGTPAAIEDAAPLLKDAGILCEILPFARAYHSKAFEPALDTIRSFFRDVPVRSPSTTIYSCATRQAMPDDVESIRSLAIDQWVSRVDFRSTIEKMYDDGVRLFVEVGARGNLTGYVADILRDRPYFAVPANTSARSGTTQLNHLVASLYAQGVPIDPRNLYARRRPQSINLSRDLPEPSPPTAKSPFQLSESLARRLREKIGTNPTLAKAWNGSDAVRPFVHAYTHSDRHAAMRDEPALGPSSAKNGRISFETVAPNPAPASGKTGEDANLVAFFETMDAFLETQREVMQAYLLARAPGGSAPTAPRFDDDGSAEPVAASTNGAVASVGLAVTNGRMKEAIKDKNTSVPLNIQDVLLEQVSLRTGYPRSMLGLDLDMEGDLGIDSIKRVEIFGEIESRGVAPGGIKLDRLSRCRTLGQVIELLDGPSSDRSTPELSTRAPRWAGEIESLTEGRAVTAIRWLDARNDPVASQHTLGGRRVSEVEPGRLGLPVVPFTVMAEMLAQAALLLAPNRVVIGFRDVQANRWLSYEESPVAFEIHATRNPAVPDEVQVRLRPRGTGETRNGNDDATFTGVVLLGAHRPAPKEAAFSAVPSDRACRFSGEELYRDQWLFHGPKLQALTHVGKSSPEGIEGTLTVLPRRALFPETLWPTLHTDPIVLDAFTHLLGAWGLDKQAGDEGDVMFPLRLAKLSLYGSDLDEGTSVQCRIRVRDVGRHRVVVDAEIARPDGQVWMALSGWEDWRFYWPGRYRDVLRDPKTILLGEPLEVKGSAKMIAVWLEPPVDMGRPIWRDVLLWTQLSPNERMELNSRHESDIFLNEALFKRIAVKEVIRRFLLARGEPSMYPSDLEVEELADGRMRVKSLLHIQLDDLPLVSIAGTDIAVIAALSTEPSEQIGLGFTTVSANQPAHESFIKAARQAVTCLTNDKHGDQWTAQTFDEAAGVMTLTTHDGKIRRCAVERRGEFAWAWTNASENAE